jgi:hypothetical protein
LDEAIAILRVVGAAHLAVFGEVVQADDLDSATEEFIDEVAANESG